MPIIVPGPPAPPTDPDFTLIGLPGNPVRCHPPVVQHAAGETIEWGVDLTRLSGQAIPGNPTAALTDYLTRLPVALPDAPGAAAGLIAQVITAATLTAGRIYRLELSYDAAGGDTRLAVRFDIDCPQ